MKTRIRIIIKCRNRLSKMKKRKQTVEKRKMKETWVKKKYDAIKIAN